MAKIIKSIDEMIQSILEEVDGQENFGEIASIVEYLKSDLIIDGENKAQICYDELVELGEQRIADKYIKPLLEKFK